MQQSIKKSSPKLTLNAEPDYLSLVTRFVEESAVVFGMSRDDYLGLHLAAEEIFLHLGSKLCPGEPIEIVCRDGVYYIRVQFIFTAPEMDMGGLNITSHADGPDDQDLEEMGLLIAARSVDHLNITLEGRNRICLEVTKEKSYPRVSERLPSPAEPLPFTIERPQDREIVKRFALRVYDCCKEGLFPPFFYHPGKVVDMIAGGEFDMLAALNRRRDVIAGVLFGNRAENIVQCFGPYIFTDEGGEAAAKGLLDALLGKMARTKALGLLNVDVPGVLQPHFEKLGALTYYREKGGPLGREIFYRHLHEDPCCEVWAHDDIGPFLDSVYRRLVLAREVRNVRPMGEARSGRSIFSAEIYRESSEARLRQLWPGADAQANLERHIRYLRMSGLLNIFFGLDLGVSRDAELIPVLTACNFLPRLLMPFAATSDLAVFQHYEA